VVDHMQEADTDTGKTSVPETISFTVTVSYLCVSYPPKGQTPA
jgi:hypothetical protein